MASQPKSLVNVGGVTLDADTVTFPGDRKFRDAWTYEDGVVSIHMPTAKKAHARQLVREAKERARKAEERETLSAFQEDAGAEAADATEKVRFKGRPRTQAVRRIKRAKTPEELAAITLDDAF